MTIAARNVGAQDALPLPPVRRRRWTRFMAWLIGLDADRLATARTESRYAATAIGILLLLSLTFAFMAMAIFSYAKLPADWPPAGRLAGVMVASVGWIVLMGNIDRVLLLLGEAIDPGSWRKAVLLVARLGVSIMLSVLFAEQIIHFVYAGPISIAAGQLAFERRATDAGRLETLYGLPDLKIQIGAGSQRVNQLAEARRTLPEDVRRRFAEAEKAKSSRDRQAAYVAALRTKYNRESRPAELAYLHDRLSQAQQRAIELSRKWAQLNDAAEHARAAYLQDIDDQMGTARGNLSKASQHLDDASAKMRAENQARGEQTNKDFSDGSTAEIALARASLDHPEIVRTVWMLRIVLVVLDVLPIFLKTLVVNNPLFLGSRAILAQEAAAARLRERMSQADQVAWADALVRPDVALAREAAAVANASALAPLHDLERLVEQLAASEQAMRAAARRHPDQAASIWGAYFEAVRAAFAGATPDPAPPSRMAAAE